MRVNYIVRVRRGWSLGFVIKHSSFDESESTQLTEPGEFYRIEKELAISEIIYMGNYKNYAFSILRDQ